MNGWPINEDIIIIILLTVEWHLRKKHHIGEIFKALVVNIVHTRSSSFTMHTKPLFSQAHNPFSNDVQHLLLNTSRIWKQIMPLTQFGPLTTSSVGSQSLLVRYTFFF